MKTMKIKLFTLFLALTIMSFISGCVKEPVGDMVVSVSINGFSVAKGAKVYTRPASEQGVTDEFGSVLLKNIEAGSYEVYAELENVGSGKSVVKIKPDELNPVFINLIPGLNVGLSPLIELILPSLPAEFSVGEEIQFSAQISDDKTSTVNLKVEWKSDKDGVLSTQKASANGTVGFSTKTLSRNEHNITLTVTDEENFSSTHTFALSMLAPAAINLIRAEKSNGGVVLQWDSYKGSDFQKYEIYRSDNNCDYNQRTLLGEITSLSATSFTDKYPPLEYQVCYFVRVYNTEGKSRNSNTLKVDLPSGTLFNFTPYDMVVHPTDSYVYLLDQNAQKLIQYNYESGVVEKSREISGQPGYMAIGDNGMGLEIYIPSGDGFIYIYDAQNLNFTGSINTGLFTMSVVSFDNGYIAAGMAPSPWWDGPIRTYKRSNGLQVDSDGDFERSRIRKLNNKNELLTISTTVSPVDLDYYKLDNNGMFLEHKDDIYHGDHPLDPVSFRIDDTGTYMITGFEGAVYLANSSMQYKGLVQRGSLNFSDFAFSDDGAIIYAGTGNRKSIQIARYPSLLRENEISLRGFPVIIEKKGNRLICINKRTESDIVSGVEVVEL